MSITLKQANTIIDAILKRAPELDCRPISAVVVDAGCLVKAFQKEDGASMSRFEMAYGKCYAALSLGRSSSLVKVRQQEKPEFVSFLIGTSGDRMFAEGGGRLIRDIKGDVIANGQVQKDWGLHLIDVNLAMGNLIGIVAEQHSQSIAGEWG